MRSMKRLSIIVASHAVSREKDVDGKGNTLLRSLVIPLCVLISLSLNGCAQFSSNSDGAALPVTLQVPDDARRVLQASVSEGFQVYRCASEGTWVLLGPMALLRNQEDPHEDEAVVHYFGPNWQYQDGSVVVGEVVAKEPRRNAIPELLIKVIAHGGPDGLFSGVTHIQRLQTSGGFATPHCDVIHDTMELVVPYKATYHFWQSH